MYTTRRRAVELLSGTSVLFFTQNTEAFTFNGGNVAAAPGAILTSIILTNTSGSTLAAGSVSQMKGFSFKKGDIPTGQWPKFQLTDGTVVPCTLLNSMATYWSDGSLKFVPGMVANPTPIGAGISVTVNVLNGGSLPVASSRSYNDAVNGITPQLQLDLLDSGWRSQLTGYVADLGGAISSPIKIVSYGNGACGGFWKVTANVAFGGTADGQLTCDFYIASLANLDGSFKGLRFALRPRLPYYDLNTHAKSFVTFSRLQFVDANSSTVLFDAFGDATNGWRFGSNRAFAFSIASPGTILTATSGYSTAFDGDYGYALRPSGGSLPTPLSANTTVFMGSGATSSTMRLSVTSSGISGSVSITSAGSGTFTPYPLLCYFAAPWLINQDTSMIWVKGAGSDTTDTPLRISLNLSGKNYFVSTGLIPHADTSIPAPTDCPSVQYWINCGQPMERSTNNGGSRKDIGPWTGFSAIQFHRQTAISDRCVRTISFIAGNLSFYMQNSTTLSGPVCNNGHWVSGTTYTQYSGMPTATPNFRWTASGGGAGSTSGFTDTTTATVNQNGFGLTDTQHLPEFNYYAYLVFGEPMHWDMLKDMAEAALYIQSAGGPSAASVSNIHWSPRGGNWRNTTYTSGTIYALGPTPSSQRGMAWALRNIVQCAAVSPAIDPETPSHTQYSIDRVRDAGRAIVALLAMMTTAGMTFALNNGLWFTQEGSDPWVDNWMMLGYMGSTLCYGISAMEDSNFATGLDNMMLYADSMVANEGGWHVGDGQTVMRISTAGGSQLITNVNQRGHQGVQISWVNSTTSPPNGKFTYVGPVSNSVAWKAQIDATIIFSFSGSSFTTATPTGFNTNQPYYIVNPVGTGGAGTTFDLSATSGGSGTPIPLTDAHSNASDSWYVTYGPNPPATGALSSMSPDGHNTLIAGVLSWANYLGHGPLTATLADLRFRDSSFPINYTSDPTWAIAP